MTLPIDVVLILRSLGFVQEYNMPVDVINNYFVKYYANDVKIVMSFDSEYINFFINTKYINSDQVHSKFIYNISKDILNSDINVFEEKITNSVKHIEFLFNKELMD